MATKTKNLNSPMAIENRQKTDKRKAPRTAFKPGTSGNPGGRPRRTAEEFELIEACAKKVPEALDTIIDLMKNSKQDSVRLAAATSIIERKYGKAVDRKEVRTGPLDGLSYDDLVMLNDALAATMGGGGRDSVGQLRDGTETMIAGVAVDVRRCSSFDAPKLPLVTAR